MAESAKAESKALLDLSNKVIVVTGAAGGFGLDLCRLLVDRRPRVLVIIDVAEEKGRDAARTLSQSGSRVEFVKCDLSDMAQIRSAITSILADHGGIDVLVNNAGFGVGSFDDAVEAGDMMGNPERDLKMTLVNYVACVYGTQLAVTAAVKAKRPLVVVSTSSMAGLMPVEHQEPIYSSGKAAVIFFMRNLKKWEAKGIRCSTVCPAASPDTGFVHAMGDDPESFRKRLKEFLIPVRQVAEALLKCIEDPKLAGQTVLALPRGTAVWIEGRGRALGIDKFLTEGAGASKI